MMIKEIQIIKEGERCAGKRWADGERCKKMPVTGRRYCRSHGGTRAAGLASGRFKTGKYSKFLPARMLSGYHALLKSGDQLNLAHELAVLDARLQDLLTRVDTEESGALWGKLQEAWGKWEVSEKRGDVGGMEGAIGELGGLIGKGHADYEAWGAIQKVIEQRRKVADTEQRRMVSSVTVIQQQEALALMAAVTEVITRHVTDKKALTSIVVDMHHLMTRDEQPVYGVEE